MKKILLTAAASLASLISIAQNFALDGLTYVVNEGTATVTVDGMESRSDYPTVINVPPAVEYEGVTYTVSEIGIAAFYGLSRVTSMTLPTTITALGDHCFEGLGINEFVLPPAVTVLPKSVLARCKKLTSVTLHDGLTEIGTAAFQECKALAALELPASITAIGNSAFLDCEALADVNYLGNAITWMQIDFASDTANPLHVAHIWKVKGNIPTAINVMPKVGEVRPYVFAGCTSLISVDIMDGISTIGEYAFSGCTGLESISFPESMTTVAEWAFKECTSMKKFYAGSIESFLKIDMGGFFANPMNAGADLYAPQGQSYATAVTELTVPESITAIKDYALDGNTSITSVILHPGVASIGTSSFQKCTALQTINMPEGLTSIGMQAFNGCAALDNVVIPTSVTDIGARTFENCVALENITLPETMTRIPDHMFMASGLKTVTLPDAVSEIGIGAFLNCTSLSALNFPEELFRIGDNAFQSTSLTEALIITSPKLRFVGQQAFYGCGSLANVLLPASVTNVGAEAFAFAGSLKSLTCKAVKAPYAQPNMCQSETYAKCTLTVPEGSLDSYRQANGWSSFSTIEEETSSSAICVQAASDNAPIRYFGLDGKEVSSDRLHPGVYIRKSGAHTVKTVIR